MPAVFGGLALLYLLTAGGRVGGNDADLMLRVTRSLLQGTVAVDDPALMTGVGDQHYSHFGLLTSLWYIPFVLLGRGLALVLPQFSQDMWEEFVVSFASVPVALALLAYLCWVWRRQGLEERRIAIGLLIVGLGTMVFSYAKLLSSDLLMTLALFAGWAHCRYGTGRWSCLLAGFWLGLALLSRKQAQIIVPVLGLGMMIHLLQAGRKRDLLEIFLGALPPVLLTLWYNWARWDSPWQDIYPPMTIPHPDGLAEWIGAFYRVLAGEYSGFFLFNLPLLVILLMTIRPWYRRDRPEAMTMLAVFVTQVCFFAYMGPRLGPISFGARLMLLCVPLLALAWGSCPLTVPGWTNGLLLGTCIIGFFIQLLGVAIDPLAAWQRRQAEQRIDEPILLAHAAELGRTLGLTPPPPPPPGGENLTIYRHPAFQEPDFWWWHFIRRRSHGPAAP